MKVDHLNVLAGLLGFHLNQACELGAVVQPLGDIRVEVAELGRPAFLPCVQPVDQAGGQRKQGRELRTKAARVSSDELDLRRSLVSPRAVGPACSASCHVGSLPSCNV